MGNGALPLFQGEPCFLTVRSTTKNLEEMLLVDGR